MSTVYRDGIAAAGLETQAPCQWALSKIDSIGTVACSENHAMKVGAEASA